MVDSPVYGEEEGLWGLTVVGGVLDQYFCPSI